MFSGPRSMLMAAALVSAPLPGAQQLFAAPMPRIVWVGEVHGTVEQPRLFADLVSAASTVGRPVFVVLERDQAEQPFWDAYMASNGDNSAKAAFLRAHSWVWSFQDGRSSRAMMDLAERLRSLHQARHLAGVRLMIPDIVFRTLDDYEGNMSRVVQGLAKSHPEAIILVFSGNAHASRGQRNSDGVTYTFAAGHLPAGSVTSVFIEGGPGWAWNCQTDCGPNPTDGYPSHARGVSISAEKPGYDAIAWTGLPSIASPPAAMPAVRVELPR